MLTKSAAFFSVAFGATGAAGSPFGSVFSSLVRSAAEERPAFLATMCAGCAIGLTSSQSTYGVAYFRVIEVLSSPTSGKSVESTPAVEPAIEKYWVPLVTLPLSSNFAES